MFLPSAHTLNLPNNDAAKINRLQYFFVPKMRLFKGYEEQHLAVTFDLS